MKLCGHNICAEHFSSYAPSLSAVEMSECFGRSAPSVTWLRPAWVSPCLSVGPLPAPPSLPQIGAGPPPQSRRSAAVPAAAEQERPFEENTTTSSQHSLVPTASVGDTQVSRRLFAPFFCMKLLFSSHTWVSHCSLWQPCQDLAKVCRMAKNLFRHLLFFKFSVPILLEAFEIFWGRLYNLEHLFLPSLAQSQRSASVL